MVCELVNGGNRVSEKICGGPVPIAQHPWLTCNKRGVYEEDTQSVCQERGPSLGGKKKDHRRIYKGKLKGDWYGGGVGEKTKKCINTRGRSADEEWRGEATTQRKKPGQKKKSGAWERPREIIRGTTKKKMRMSRA